MPEESLKDKTVKGVAWSGIDNVAQFGVSFVVSIILARLLTPDDYGLLGIILIFSSICSALMYAGFNTALIRMPKANDDDFNTCFIANLVLSAFFYLLIYVFSPYIGEFFDREELVGLTRITSLTLIIAAFSMIQQTRLTMKIDFKSQAIVTLASSLSSGFVGIGMALLECGVWALVFQTLSAQIVRTILLCVYDRWRPLLRFSSKSFQLLFGFGWKMMVSAFLDSLWQQLYQVVVGKFYNPATLGQYTRAKQFSLLFSSNVSNAIQRVTYPVLSHIQYDNEMMSHAYRKIIKQTMFISAICMFALGAVSEPLLYCLIGSQWYQATLYLPLICISGSFYPLHSINLNMLQVQGRSDLFLGLEIIKKIVALAPLAVGAFVGIIPMLYVNILSTFICFLLNSHYSGKFIGYSSWMQIKDVAPSYGIAIIVSLSIYFIKYLPMSFWIILPLQIMVGGIVFIVICRITKNEEFFEFINIVRPFLNKIRH